MDQSERTRRPIGYWLRRADELLTRRIDEAQHANGLTRLDWQTLNVIRETGTATHAQIANALAPFADAEAFGAVLRALSTRGVIGGSFESGVALTPAGHALYERALAAQQAIRQRAFAGVSEAEYATTVSVLQRLVGNLET